ncbi:STAS domain-containing protein [Phaeacidiphilus oryzae]|uniref:STAS domain-containing protein n=1 Tax=Phaeacidiphilus oryzae TaxID=348818 RepID=UPI00068EB102
MTLSVATERSGDWILLRVAGDIDLFSGAVIRERVHEQVADGCHLLVLDLTGVRFCDSSGVGVLIAARRLLRSCGGLLRLVLPDVPPDGGRPPVSAHVHRVFTALGVRRLFDIHPDVDSAIVGEPGREPDPEADAALPLGAVPGQDPGPDPAAERLSA